MTNRLAEEAKDYREFLDQLRSEPGYWKHFTILQFTTAMARLMKKHPRVSGKKLAQLLGVSPPTVSKALSGGENLTVETMTKLAAALNAAVHIHVAPKGVAVQWVEASETDKIAIVFNVTAKLGFTSESAFAPPGYFQTGSESVQYVN
jgi:transcriptional regulator with XRE-family HTH domain